MRATLATAALLCALAVVAAAPVRKEDPLPPVTEKHLKDSQNNLKQIGIAFHGFHDTVGFLPVDITDRAGKPLLSWRVAILPFIEEEKLYKEFKLDEPWDSAANKKLIEKMPKIYTPVRVKGKLGDTFYQTFTGKGALFGPMKRPLIPGSIPDGTKRTGMVFEAGEAVVWTMPADIPFDEEKPLPKLGGHFDGDSNVVLCNGSVIRVRKNADRATLKYFIMPADGHVIDLDKLTNPRS